MKKILIIIALLQFPNISTGVYLTSKGSIQHNFALQSPTTSSISHFVQMKNLAISIPLGIMSYIFLTTSSKRISERRESPYILRNFLFLSLGFIGLSGAESSSLALEESYGCDALSMIKKSTFDFSLKHHHLLENCKNHQSKTIRDICVFHEYHLLSNLVVSEKESKEPKFLYLGDNESIYVLYHDLESYWFLDVSAIKSVELVPLSIYMITDKTTKVTVVSTNSRNETLLCIY